MHFIISVCVQLEGEQSILLPACARPPADMDLQSSKQSNILKSCFMWLHFFLIYTTGQWGECWQRGEDRHMWGHNILVTRHHSNQTIGKAFHKHMTKNLPQVPNGVTLDTGSDVSTGTRGLPVGFEKILRFTLSCFGNTFKACLA